LRKGIGRGIPSPIKEHQGRESRAMNQEEKTRKRQNAIRATRTYKAGKGLVGMEHMRSLNCGFIF
jgi:hypothetical protein